jgi:uncharacterized protein YaaQ
MEKRIMARIDEVQAAADAALTAVRAANGKTDRVIQALVDVRAQLAAFQGGADPERLNDVIATLNQAINEANEQMAQDDAAVTA